MVQYWFRLHNRTPNKDTSIRVFIAKVELFFSLQVLDSVFKECRKDNPTYKMAALKCFGEIVQDYSIDRFKQISELLFPIIAPVSALLKYLLECNFSPKHQLIIKGTGNKNKENDKPRG